MISLVWREHENGINVKRDKNLKKQFQVSFSSIVGKKYKNQNLKVGKYLNYIFDLYLLKQLYGWCVFYFDDR